jgi:hypothetical protein
MSYKISLAILFVVLGLSFATPKTASAFWWFNQKKAETPIVVNTYGLNDQAKLKADAKYKIWEAGFEKRNIDVVISNYDKFSFTPQELNYLFENIGKTVKTPTITNVSLTSSNGNVNVAANFHKFVKGRFSFVAKVVPSENKIRLELSYVKLYGINVPAKWLSEPVNKALDEYFSFLYKDARYQGFSFVIQDNLLQLKPEFKK